MMPGFVDNVTDGLSNAWNWLRGNKPSTEENTEQKTTLPQEQPAEAPAVTAVPPPLKQSDELIESLFLLHAEHLEHSSEKCKRTYHQFKGLHDNHQTLTSLLDKINQKTDEKGKLHILAEDKELIELLERAKKQGIEVDLDKKAYEKDHVGKLVSSIENKTGHYQTDLKLKEKELNECEHQRNLCMQILKTMFDKYSEVIKKILNAVSSR